MVSNTSAVRCLCLVVIGLMLGMALCACVTTDASNHGGHAGPTSVAVWDFEALGDMTPAQTAMGEMLAARIVDRLNQSPDFEVVEREKIVNILQEQKLGASQLVDERTRLELGRIIGCRQMVFGAYQLLGDTMRMDLRIVDVTSGKVLKTSDAAAPAQNIAAWLDTADTAATGLITP